MNLWKKGSVREGKAGLPGLGQGLCSKFLLRDRFDPPPLSRNAQSRTLAANAIVARMTPWNYSPRPAHQDIHRRPARGRPLPTRWPASSVKSCLKWRSCCLGGDEEQPLVLLRSWGGTVGPFGKAGIAAALEKPAAVLPAAEEQPAAFRSSLENDRVV